MSVQAFVENTWDFILKIEGFMEDFSNENMMTQWKHSLWNFHQEGMYGVDLWRGGKQREEPGHCHCPSVAPTKKAKMKILITYSLPSVVINSRNPEMSET